MPQQRHYAIIAVAALLVIGAVASPAAASHNDGNDESIIQSIEAADVPAWGYITAAKSGIQQRISHQLNPGSQTATEAAADLKTWFNSGSIAEDTANWTNERYSASTDANVLALHHKINGETETVYIVANVSDSSYEPSSAAIVNETSRTVDHECSLTGAAARNSQEEAKVFYDRFVAEDKDLNKGHLVQLRLEYGSKTSCSFLNSTTTSGGGWF